MEINQAQEPDYETVKIDYVGFVDPYAVEGMLVLKASDGKLDGVLQLIIDIRKEARNKKDFMTSDKIRNTLQSLGISLKDEKDGSVSWSL